MSARVNRQWTVAKRPRTRLADEHFGYVETEIAEPSDGEVLLKTHVLNIAPVMRMYMMEGGDAGEAELPIGGVIHGRGVAEVVASRHPDYSIGEFVQGQIGWQTYKLSRMAKAERVRKLKPNGLPVHVALSALGMTGFSAWCGFFSRGEPKAGDAVLVSGAAGGVGSLVVQMAKIIGCSPVIGIAGGADKCALVRDLGCDAVIDYKADGVDARIGELLPDGFDVYFDNVGGEILDAALNHIGQNARIVSCGSISEYTRDSGFGPTNYTNLRDANADLRGFFVYNHADEFDDAEAEMAAWLRSGELRVVVDQVNGFENMPRALMEMYSGTGGGKRLVAVASNGEVPVY